MIPHITKKCNSGILSTYFANNVNQEVKKMAYKRLILIFCAISLCAITLLVRTASIADGTLYQKAQNSTFKQTITVYAASARGNIYDCNMNIINNTSSVKNAVILPDAQSIEAVSRYAIDYEAFYKNALNGKPFCTLISYGDFFCKNVHVFDIATQNKASNLFTHVVGYCDESSNGISGLEYAFNDILNEYSRENSVTYCIDGNGSVIAGESQKVTLAENALGGIVTTLDTRFQQICLEAAKGYIDKGAIVIMDIATGDIKAMASFPTYSYSQIETALNDANSPLINRALYSYSVGSIFKLVIASCGIDQGLEDFVYDCKGSTDIGAQTFKCHNISGHGEQNMTQALVNSCNPYFIELSVKIDAETLRSYALAFGFGKRIELAKSISSSAGTLPSLEDLSIKAEKANFSFGQGLLTATPLQICTMTCAIAGYGEMPKPRLYVGTTDDGVNVNVKNECSYSYAISVSTARKVRDFMDAVVIDNSNSNARAFNTTCGAKTSTAQTGRYDENGNEYCHSWITGYFPAQKPRYAVTVLCENGGYGNEKAAPVFKYIAEEITSLCNEN